MPTLCLREASWLRYWWCVKRLLCQVRLVPTFTQGESEGLTPQLGGFSVNITLKNFGRGLRGCGAAAVSRGTNWARTPGAQNLRLSFFTASGLIFEVFSMLWQEYFNFWCFLFILMESAFLANLLFSWFREKIDLHDKNYLHLKTTNTPKI